MIAQNFLGATLFCLFSIHSVSAMPVIQFNDLVSDPKVKSKKVEKATLEFLVQSCNEQSLVKARDTVQQLLVSKLRFLNVKRVNDDQGLTLEYLINSYQFLNLCNENSLGFSGDADFISFLLSSHKKILKLSEGIDARDDIPRVFEILKLLFEQEVAADRDEFFDLMLAMAIVWDQPRRDIHGQIGQYNKLPYEVDLSKRYAFYKRIYDKNKAKMKYRYLDYSDLIYVVDTPIPLAEMEWVQKKVKGTLSAWGKKYASIRYDTPRLNKGLYSWPRSQGPYTLASIKEYGGICVDQAYYCTMTARAFGIPALYFSGQGKTGGHAWFSYMKKKDSWTLDIGRYGGSSDYVTGYARNPQTNGQMSDHEVAMVYNRAFARSNYKKGHKFQLYADLMLDSGYTDQALTLAQYATGLAPLDVECWNSSIKCAKKTNVNELILAVFDGKIKALKKYPDLIVDAQLEKADLLNKMGRGDEADKVLSTARRKVGKGRDDLARDLALKQMNTLIEQKKFKEARSCMEKLIKDQRSEQAKLLDFIKIYLKMTKKTKQTKEALRFISPLIKSMYKKFHTSYRNHAVDLLASAYMNNGDDKTANKIRDKYKK